jgi:hypothetical protein
VPTARAGRGCPNPQPSGDGDQLDGQELYGPDTFQTNALGGSDIRGCGLPGLGFASAAPNFTMFLSGMEQLRAAGDRGELGCDTNASGA